MADTPDSSDKSPVQEATPQATPDSKSTGDGQDSLDARFGSFGMGAAAPDDKYTYNMTHKTRGLFIIINNKNFDSSTGMGPRSGTDMDAANLYQRFKELGFEIRKYDNLKKAEMLKAMTHAAGEDHTNADCFACAILSHGDEGVVYGRDGQIELDRLISPFKGPRCASLLGKPKIFVIQACRGTELDHGVEVIKADADSPMETDQVYKIPTEADFVYAYSTVAGYFSWRNSTRGSWFIQALCRMLKEHSRSMDLLRILTRVSHEVAYEFESNASKESMNRKKQIPSVVSMLTKDIIFAKK